MVAHTCEPRPGMTSVDRATNLSAPSWARWFGFDRPWLGPLVVALVALAWFHGIVALANPAYWFTQSAWDEVYYLDIARKGYELPGGDYGQYTRLPFSPGLPMLLRGVSSLTGLDPLVVRLPLSALLFTVGCSALGWVLRAFSGNHLRNNLTVLAFAFWPGSIYFVNSYAECLYMPLLMLSFGCMLRRWWLAAACCAAACWFTRTPAVVVVGSLCVAVLLDGWQSRAPLALLKSFAMAVLCGAVASLGLLGYMAMVHHATGDWFAFRTSYVAWEPTEILNHRGITLRSMADALYLYPDRPTLFLAVPWFVLLPVLVFVQRRTMPVVLTVFTGGAWLFFLVNDWLRIPYHDMLRWLAVVFPASYAVVTLLEARGRLLRVVLGVLWFATSLALHAWCTIRYVTGLWVS